jgi:hypothetical protein
VREGGWIAGVTHRQSGRFVKLPPGASYQLHSKDYEEAILTQRSDLFQLGPYWVVVVKRASIAGAYNRHSGFFHVFPPGNTYWLLGDEYEKPMVAQIGSHVTVCGPLTLLSREDGILAGAYRVSDGEFVEFFAEDEESHGEGDLLVLHAKDYHGIVRVPKNVYSPQPFGPQTIITVRDTYAAVFLDEGRIQIKNAGFFKVPAKVQIGDMLPLAVQNSKIEVDFKTRDGVDMRFNAMLSWQIRDSLQVAKLNMLLREEHGAAAFKRGALTVIEDEIVERCEAIVTKLAKNFARVELLPTEEDVQSRVEQKGEEVRVAQMQGMDLGPLMTASTATQTQVSFLNSENEGTPSSRDIEKFVLFELRQMQEELKANAVKDLGESCDSAGYGCLIVDLQVGGFFLLDKKIEKDLSEITSARLAAKAARVRGEVDLVSAEADRRCYAARAAAKAEVAKTLATARADVQMLEAKSEAEASLAIELAKAEADAKKKQLWVSVESRTKQEAAEAEAEAISVLAEANAEKIKLEKSVLNEMTPEEHEYRLAAIAVEAMAAAGEANWRHPHEISGIVSQFLPHLRLGPLPLKEAMLASEREMKLQAELASQASTN